MNASVLMYHDVVAPGREESSGFPGGESARYKLTLDTFGQHLRAMRRRCGRRPITVDSPEFEIAGSGCEPALLLTFDDGGSSAATIADCLEVFGWRGHFFVTTNYIGRPSFVTAAQIRDLRARGHVVGSHSCSHPLRMALCSAAKLRDEWTRSVSTLGHLLGEPCLVASVPGGEYSPSVGDAASEAGIRLLFTSRPTVRVRRQDDLQLLGRFAVRNSTPPAVVAAVAAGCWTARVKQLISWDLRAALKLVAGPAYERIRTRRLGRSADMRWGDGC